MSKFTLLHKVGDIVTTLPKASSIFSQYKIDFCCGGNRTLQQVFEAEKHHNPTKILSELNTALEEWEKEKKEKSRVTDFALLSTPDLIDHIVHTHHKYLNENLPEISRLTLKILNAHYKNSQQALLLKIYHLFHQLKMELEVHLIEEEKVVFPMLKEYSNTKDEKLKEKISRLETEHQAAGDLLKELSSITSDYTKPDNLCKTVALTLMKLKELQQDLFQHIHLENNILFKRFETK